MYTVHLERLGSIHDFQCIAAIASQHPTMVTSESSLPALRLIHPPVGCIEDLHPQVSSPCRAHNKKGEKIKFSLPNMCTNL
jgi:hypothetical protein